MRQLIATALVLVLAAAAWAAPPTLTTGHPKPRMFAFLSHADGRETAHLRAFASCIEIVAPNWHTLSARRATVTRRAPDPELTRLASELGFELWPVVNARTDGRRTVSGAGFRRRAATAIAETAAGGGYPGVTLDLEGLRPDQRAAFTRFVRLLAGRLHRTGVELAVYVPRFSAPGLSDASAYDWPALAGAADLLLASGYNEHSAATEPGPIATSEGFAQIVDDALSVDPGRVVPLQGAIGYRWPGTGGTGELVASADAGARRRELGVAGRRSDGNRTYRDRGDVVWYQTAAGLRHRAALAADAGARWLGLFSLGREPRSYWRGCTSS